MQQIHQLFSKLGLAVLFAGLVSAQFNSGIEGTVNDSTQAGIPGAQVGLVNEGTQVTQRTTASESGFFRIAHLPPGFASGKSSSHRLSRPGGGRTSFDRPSHGRRQSTTSCMTG